ncbi:hypothetical protein AB0F42_13375 [Streptomyces buecherae]|uniref:hypothetical protein n=1 Tax=Streptomyces buecherae TaxID=2763006 RepID=UPI0034013C55
MELARAQTPRDGARPRAVHVRTAESLSRPRAGELDLVCGSVVTVGAAPELAGFEVMEWRRSGLALLTNLPADRLLGPRARVGELPALPLVVPTTRLIGGFLRGWFGAGFRQTLTVAAEIDTIGYGFELLRSGLVEGCLLVTQGIAEAAADGRLPEAAGLRPLTLVDETGPELRVLSGAFARLGERAALARDHPLNVLWRCLAAGHERRVSAAR